MKESDKPINPEEWNCEKVEEDSFYGLHNHLLSEVSLSSQVLLKNHHIYSNLVENRNKISNQESSGRCWIFAGLNIIRNKFISEENLKPDFEFSQNYLFFWDKFERINYYTHLYEELYKNNESINDRLMQHLLNDPLGDGGQWQMLVNLIEKYGLVPKSIFPETKHSSNSAGINKVLTSKLRDYCREIRKNKFNRDKALKEVYSLLVKFLGKPPSKFTWEYLDRNQKYTKKKNLTPEDFMKLTKLDIGKYVSLVNDPREEYNYNYGVKYLNNIVEGKEVKYLNIKMDKMKELVKKSIDNNEPVWFGSDVGKFLHAKSNIMDKDVFDMEGYLGINFQLDKRERIVYGDSLMTHAMAITGYNVDDFGNINRWEIENSWGTSAMNEGYYSMSDDWMSEFVYQVIINIDYLDEENKNDWANDIIKRHPPWDPMGALAN